MHLIPLSKIIKIAMLDANRPDNYIWYKKSLVRNNGKFELILNFKNK